MFTPKFTSVSVSFVTNNITQPDRKSLPVVITSVPRVDEATTSIFVDCSDSRTRKCLYSRITNEKALIKLTKDLQKAYESGKPVIFVAAGGNDANTWFYSVE
jgi:hypothetical protein